MAGNVEVWACAEDAVSTVKVQAAAKKARLARGLLSNNTCR
jgi:hypothetical protein